MNRVIRVFTALIPLSMILAGCGGGGGGGSLTAPGRTAEVEVFATDSFRDDYDQVWVTLHRLDLLTSTGQAETILDDAGGRVLDLRCLRDAAGERFELLASGRVRPGSYSAARITVGGTVSALPKGGDIAQSLEISPEVPRDSQGRPIIEFSLQSPRNLAGTGSSLIVDFDLANFVVTGNTVQPSIKESLSQLLANAQRHERNHFTGSVSELASTNLGYTFLLQLPNGFSLRVAAGADTAIFNVNGAPNAALSNGSLVKVEGAFDSGSRLFGATEIMVLPLGEDQRHDHRAFVVGNPLRWDAHVGSIILRILRAEGFVPRTRELRINTTETTVYHDPSGVVISRERFFEMLANALIVKASGKYDRETNLFTAAHLKLGPRGDDLRVRAVGKPIEVNAHERIFHLRPIYEYEGFRPPEGGVRVVTTNTTAFYLHRDQISAERFFELLPNSPRVLVEGRYDRLTNTITASLARIVEAPDPDNHVAASGPVVEIYLDRHAFHIRPVEEYRGFEPPDRGVLVLTTAETVFRGPDGAIIRPSAFFELLAVGRRVRVEGGYNRENNALTAAVAALLAR